MNLDIKASETEGTFSAIFIQLETWRHIITYCYIVSSEDISVIFCQVFYCPKIKTCNIKKKTIREERGEIKDEFQKVE